MKLLITFVVILVLALGGIAYYNTQIAPRNIPINTITDTNANVAELRDCLNLKFSDFKPTENLISPAAEIKWTAESKEFKTAISEAVAKGVNFSGQYAIAEWGCGTACQEHALVNLQTGDITMLELTSTYGIKFQSDSSLIIVNPTANIPVDKKQKVVTTAYVLDQSGLNKLAACDIMPLAEQADPTVSKDDQTGDTITLKNGSVSASCSQDNECTLINKNLDLTQCFAGACLIIDFSLPEYVAVNSQSYTDFRQSIAPNKETCGVEPKCPTGFKLTAFLARCVDSLCQKTEDTANSYQPN